MARIARLVVPHHPHHVTQRGVRRMETFSSDADYQHYIDRVAASCKKAGTVIWAYCLMPNHVHLVMVPACEDGLRAALGEAHRNYTRMINFREKCRGHLWQERFHSFPMDETYLIACVRYVELNPVRAGLVKRPEDWRWSSATAHLQGEDDALLSHSPALERVGNWRKFLDGGVKDVELKRLHMHTKTGRPLGAEAWIKKLEAETGRPLRAKAPGRPKGAKNEG
jgi:REP-associated tyrosine transposase